MQAISAEIPFSIQPSNIQKHPTTLRPEGHPSIGLLPATPIHFRGTCLQGSILRTGAFTVLWTIAINIHSEAFAPAYWQLFALMDNARIRPYALEVVSILWHLHPAKSSNHIITKRNPHH